MLRVACVHQTSFFKLHFLEAFMALKRMIPLYINGLFPDDSKVLIFDPTIKISNDKSHEVLKGSANQDGVFQGEIPTELIGEKVTIRVRTYGFQHFEEDKIVEEYGVFSAVRLEKEYTVTVVRNAGKWEDWDSGREYTKALQKIDEKLSSDSPVAVKQSTLSLEDLKKKVEESFGSKIKDHVFEEFANEISEVELKDFAVSSLIGRIIAKNIQAEYETIKYYQFILLENFTRLISLIDHHVLYDLPDKFFMFGSSSTSRQIELNANFINYLESFSGLRTCMIEFHKSFRDELFDVDYKEMISQLPVSNKVLIQIRNKYHHARRVNLTRIVISPAGQNDRFRKYVIPVIELYEKIDKWSSEEKSWLEEQASDGFIDVKYLVLEHFQAYTSFLNRHSTILSALIRRKTGCEINLTI